MRIKLWQLGTTNVKNWKNSLIYLLAKLTVKVSMFFWLGVTYKGKYLPDYNGFNLLVCIRFRGITLVI